MFLCGRKLRKSRNESTTCRQKYFRPVDGLMRFVIVFIANGSRDNTNSGCGQWVERVEWVVVM